MEHCRGDAVRLREKAAVGIEWLIDLRVPELYGAFESGRTAREGYDCFDK